MEVCGGQTHSIIRYGLDEILPDKIRFLHGPGCPVCVTPLETIDRALSIASTENTIFCSFGDMLRVPGTKTDLLALKARGHDIRVIYSPLDALNIAQANPDQNVVFFAIGFETTAPANAMAVFQANKLNIKNFYALVSHVMTPPAISSILQAPGNVVQGFLAPGHVCTVMGYHEYEALAQAYQVPIVVTGFEPVDILEGTLSLVTMLEREQIHVDNQYIRSVSQAGNRKAQELIDQVFEICDRKWRGVGLIPKSGLKLKYEFRDYDAIYKYQIDDIETEEPQVCISGQVLRGQKKPDECQAFGSICTPRSPLGATMVSAEGACAAYFQYGRSSKLEVQDKH
jgi:hydrogenase expression/formation protein HypD